MAVNMDDLLKGSKGTQDMTLQTDDIIYIQTRSHPKSLGDILGSVGTLAFALNAAKFVGF